MSKKSKFIDRMVEIYGVPSYLNNKDDDTLWFECPECQSVISFEDYSLGEVRDCCPVCNYRWDY